MTSTLSNDSNRNSDAVSCATWILIMMCTVAVIGLTLLYMGLTRLEALSFAGACYGGFLLLAAYAWWNIQPEIDPQKLADRIKLCVRHAVHVHVEEYYDSAKESKRAISDMALSFVLEKDANFDDVPEETCMFLRTLGYHDVSMAHRDYHGGTIKFTMRKCAVTYEFEFRLRNYRQTKHRTICLLTASRELF